MQHKKSYALLIAPVIGFMSLVSCSVGKPEQINLLLKINDQEKSTLSNIVNAVAKATDMKVESQDFQYGGSNGTLRAFLIHNSRTEIMVRSTSDEECSPKQGRRSPTFSRPVYSVSIYRTSVFKPKIPLQQVAKIFEQQAGLANGQLVPESQNCQKPSPGK